MSMTRLGDAARFVNGAAFGPADWCADGEGLPIIRIQNLTGSGGTRFNHTRRAVRPELVVEPGDLLVSWSATLDVFVWQGPRGVLNQHIFKVLPHPGVDAGYLFHALRSVLKPLRGKMHGSTMKHVVRSDFEGTRIWLPELARQRSVAEMMSCADSLVHLHRACRANTAKFAQALFIDMFGDTPANPQRWPVRRFGDLLAGIDSGRSPRCHDRPRQPDEWGVLRLSALRDGEYDDLDHKALPQDVAPDPRHEVQAGDLLFSRKNTPELVGTPAYVWDTQGRILLPDLIFRLRIHPDAGLEPLYLWALLRTPAVRRRLQQMATGTTRSMSNISKERLRGLAVLLPPLALQQTYAERLAAMHAVARRQDAMVVNARAGYEALLQRCFRPPPAGG